MVPEWGRGPFEKVIIIIHQSFGALFLVSPINDGLIFNFITQNFYIPLSISPWRSQKNLLPIVQFAEIVFDKHPFLLHPGILILCPRVLSSIQ